MLPPIGGTPVNALPSTAGRSARKYVPTSSSWTATSHTAARRRGPTPSESSAATSSAGVTAACSFESRASTRLAAESAPQPTAPRVAAARVAASAKASEPIMKSPLSVAGMPAIQTVVSMPTGCSAAKRAAKSAGATRPNRCPAKAPKAAAQSAPIAIVRARKVSRLAAELLIDQAQRHHRQRPVVGLPRRGAAALDPVQRLAERRQGLPGGPQQGSRRDRSLVLPDERMVEGREIQQHRREPGEQRGQQER